MPATATVRAITPVSSLRCSPHKAGDGNHSADCADTSETIGLHVHALSLIVTSAAVTIHEFLYTEHSEVSTMSSMLALRSPCLIVSVLISLLTTVELASDNLATADQGMSTEHNG